MTSVWTWCHWKLLGKMFICKLEVLISNSKILDPNGAKTLIEGMGQKNKGLYEGGGKRCAL